ncbi:flavin reductase family protein [Nocardioides albidus]|uniref:Flavin reductase family protein n=1 Tax=Nocardioides albidus TaxID=1517589 RepID=A0A5C4W757_9ACTN|nr:flavin reductase family protein [Nocardioides albidus]TNM44097.1 flavin reductase family protein [Nocardioides albidus]
MSALAFSPTPSPAEVLEPTPDGMRRAMGAFPSGVTVVTAVHDDEPVGFTCQSFASLSLDPPLVLFCATSEGRAWARIREAEAFCVNVLAEDQVEMCQRFGSRTGLRFAGLDWATSPYGAPSLPGAVLRVHATLETVHAAGDHDIAIGRVQGLELSTAAPLVFHRGRFGLDAPKAGFAHWGEQDFWS